MSAAFGGSNIFGAAVRCNVNPHASANQTATFFGISGVLATWGGSRGRTFYVEGVLTGADFNELALAEELIESYNDGIARVFTDTWGVDWAYVVYRGEYQRTGKPLFTSTGVCQPYKMVLHGLV